MPVREGLFFHNCSPPSTSKQLVCSCRFELVERCLYTTVFWLWRICGPSPSITAPGGNPQQRGHVHSRTLFVFHGAPVNASASTHAQPTQTITHTWSGAACLNSLNGVFVTKQMGWTLLSCRSPSASSGDAPAFLSQSVKENTLLFISMDLQIVKNQIGKTHKYRINCELFRRCRYLSIKDIIYPDIYDGFSNRFA